MNNSLERLKNDPRIKEFVSQVCEDNLVCVEFDDQVSNEEFFVIKVDDYYNSLHLGKNTPASVDCLIIQECGDGQIKVYIVELKNVKSPSHINGKNLEQKFETTLFDFISNRFKEYLDTVEFKVYLLLCAGNVDNENIRAFSLDFLLGLRMFKFRGKLAAINGRPPNPLIKPC